MRTAEFLPATYRRRLGIFALNTTFDSTDKKRKQTMTAQEITLVIVRHYQMCLEYGATREAAILREILAEIQGKK
jgi:hypothetical protein